MRIVLSRKGFDSAAGGCPSPIFPDGSMFALPIPDATSPVKYRDLRWRDRDVGELVERLTRNKLARADGAHVDPDLRRELRPRKPGWRPALGVRRAAQGHLRNRGVREGDLFLFWGLFRPVDSHLHWSGEPVHAIWGWLQVGAVVAVDDARPSLGAAAHAWMRDHPHFHFPVGTTGNTLYVAAGRLALPGLTPTAAAAGVFESYSAARQLTARDAAGPSLWQVPGWLLPRGRTPLSYHDDAERWVTRKGDVLLKSAARGQEFVLPADEYPEAAEWAAALLDE